MKNKLVKKLLFLKYFTIMTKKYKFLCSRYIFSLLFLKCRICISQQGAFLPSHDLVQCTTTKWSPAKTKLVNKLFLLKYLAYWYKSLPQIYVTIKTNTCFTSIWLLIVRASEFIEFHDKIHCWEINLLMRHATMRRLAGENQGVLPLSRPQRVGFFYSE